MRRVGIILKIIILYIIIYFHTLLCNIVIVLTFCLCAAGWDSDVCMCGSARAHSACVYVWSL